MSVTMNGGVCLIIEVDDWRARRRLEHGYLDEVAEDIEDSLKRVKFYVDEGQSRSIGLIGNAVTVYPDLLKRGAVPDIVTDQTPAHDFLAYFPDGMEFNEAQELKERSPAEFVKLSAQSMARHCQAMVDFQNEGAIGFDYGNNLRQRAYDEGVEEAFSYPGFILAYIRPLFCKGKGPFRWVALSGDPEDIYRTDEAILELFH